MAKKPSSDLRAAASSVALSIDLGGQFPVLLPGKLMRTTVPNAGSAGTKSTCCPTCHDKDGSIVSMTRVAKCSDDDCGTQLPESELPRYRKVGGDKQFIGTAEEIKAATATLAAEKTSTKQLDLRAYDAATFEGVPSGDIYVIEVEGQQPTELMAVLFSILDDNDVVKSGKSQAVIAGWMDNLRSGNRQFVRLVRRFDRLAIETLEYASKFRADVPVPTMPKVAAKTVTALKSTIVENAAAFDRDEFTDPAGAELDRLIAPVEKQRSNAPTPEESNVVSLDALNHLIGVAS